MNHWASVSLRLTAMSLSDSGHIRNPGYIESCLRAALLVDLALLRRIDDGVDMYWIDCSPTGFGPADVLLAGVEQYPKRNILWWVGRGPAVHKALVRELVLLGTWHVERKPRFGRRGSYRVAFGEPEAEPEALKERVKEIVRAHGLGVRPNDAAFAVFATTAELTGPYVPPTPGVLQACGPARWIVELADATIAGDRSRRADASGVASASSFSG